MERFDPVTKRSAFFYSGPESLNRPEVQRHLKKLKEIEFRAKNLVLLPDSKKPYSRFYGPSSGKNYHICIVSSVFGVIPLEIEEIYPLNQHERPKTLDESQIDFMQSIVKSYAKGFRKVFLHEDLESLNIEGEIFGDIDAFKNGDVKVKIKAMADYLFGKGAGNALCAHARAEFAKTGRIRRIYSDDVLLATVRASDGFFVLTKEGAERIHRLEYPKNRVIIEDREVGGFIKEGRSVFAKFVVDCDPEMRPHQEVIVVDGEDNLLATGKAILNADEMLAFDRGIAVKVRRGIRD
jgi:7-cyano-7-deazaguanine tRNA-ribosyltransferase